MGFPAFFRVVASRVSLCAVIVCSAPTPGATEKTYTPKNEEEVGVLSLVLRSEIKANDWTKNGVICFSVKGQDPSPQSVKSLRQRGLNVRSSAEWTKKFNCGFEVQMEYSGFDSQSVKVRSKVVDLREINKQKGDLALLQRDGEYSLKKNDGRWSIQEYVAKLPVVSPNP
jgi:hypothetical protein